MGPQAIRGGGGNLEVLPLKKNFFMCVFPKRKRIDAKNSKYKTNYRSKNSPHTHLKPIIGPGTELHDACLLIEGKILYVYFARGLINGRRFPLHQSVVPQSGLRGQGYLKISICTEIAKRHITTKFVIP